jgi:hypothetical protein
LSCAFITIPCKLHRLIDVLVGAEGGHAALLDLHRRIDEISVR